jgi:hypothetical protein
LSTIASVSLIFFQQFPLYPKDPIGPMSEGSLGAT